MSAKYRPAPTEKSPARDRACFATTRCRSSELIVQSAAEYVFSQGCSVLSDKEIRVVATEISIEILGLCGPIPHKPCLDTPADSPSSMRIAATRQVLTRVQVAGGKATGNVRHPHAENVTSAAARRSEPS